MQVNVTRAECCPYKALLAGLTATLLGVAVIALGVGYLGSDLLTLVTAQDGLAVETVAVTDQALPVDAPTVSLVRCKAQETETNLASSGAQDEVVQLNNWTYTQSNVSFSPFMFSAPNGFDFFNPLFAMDFVSSSPGSSNPFGSTPFGFGTGSTTTGTSPGFVIATSNGNIVVGSGSPITTTTTTTPAAFLNGSQIFLSISTTTLVFPLPIGTAAFSHRHASTTAIVVVNIIVINTTPASAGS
jgi:hypothetical protein